MDQIYEDFKAKMLPRVAEGLVITKDYFVDLFGRYVKFLIITDAIWLLVCILGLVVSACYIKKVYKAIDDGYGGGMFIVFYLVIPVLFGVGIIDKSHDLVKDFYIPEVRVYEQFNPPTRQ